MSQQDVLNFLKHSPGVKFTAEELQRFLNIRTGIYTNLAKLRPKCKLGHFVLGNPEKCRECKLPLDLGEGVRCAFGIHKVDSRENVYFYYWVKK